MLKIFRNWLIIVFVIILLFFIPYTIVNKVCANINSSIPKIPEAAFSINEIQNNIYARLNYLILNAPEVKFYLYKVKMRDNLWKIAKRQGYSVHTIIGCNPQLQTYRINYKEPLIISSIGGTLHPVQKNDTWEKIADRYKIEEEKIKATNSGIQELIEGEFLFIPGKRPDLELLNPKMREKYELRSLFVSPLGGRLSSFFGKRKHPVTGLASFHEGIDIAVKTGTWVGAAADGVVILAGDGVGHYGKAVFIDHKNGYITHYGHLSKIYVRVGQKVKARKLIAKSGSTGRSTGPHLHFTIKKNGVSQDPLKYIW
ncbi:MAG: M23 family metallopeptidase [Elusimicrobiota bacterium]